MSNLKSWFLAARPKTLTAALVPIVVSTCFAIYWLRANPNSQIVVVQYWIGIVAFLCSILIQIATNFYNDAIDFKKGADNNRIGPTRASSSGLIPSEALLQAGHFCLFLATVMGVLLVAHGGLPILWVGLFSVFFSYAYTGGPYPLAYKGLGDFFVLLFFGWIAVLGMTYLYIKELPIEAFLIGTQVGCLATSLIAVNNYRDQIGDKAVGKMTMAARFGTTFSRIEYLFLIAVPYAISVFFIFNKIGKAGYLTLLTIPLGVFLIYQVFTTEPSSKLNRALGLSALHHLLFGVLLSVGFLFSH